MALTREQREGGLAHLGVTPQELIKMEAEDQAATYQLILEWVEEQTEDTTDGDWVYEGNQRGHQADG